MFLPFVDGDGNEYGSCEVFRITDINIRCDNGSAAEFGITEPGWYWWACFPGCLPDGDPVGPFATEGEAIENAGAR